MKAAKTNYNRGKEGNAPMEDVDMLWYQWNQPSTLTEGEAKGDNLNYKKYRDAYDRVTVTKSEPTSNDKNMVYNLNKQTSLKRPPLRKKGGEVGKGGLSMYKKGGWLNKYQTGAALNVERHDNSPFPITNSHYDPAADRVFLTSDDYDNPAVLQHELFHMLQNKADYLRDPDEYEGPLLRPAVTAVDPMKMEYWNRRKLDLNEGIKDFYKDPSNASFMFLPEDMMYKYVYQPEMYANPYTAEGEAQMYENATHMNTYDPKLYSNPTTRLTEDMIKNMSQEEAEMLWEKLLNESYNTMNSIPIPNDPYKKGGNKKIRYK
jgi:hypothetical protein